MHKSAAGFRLSPYQDFLWSLQPNGPNGGGQTILELAGHVDSDRLRTVLSRVVQRHEILRTTFQRQPGIKTPLQTVEDILEPGWQTIDLTALDPPAQLLRVDELAAEDQSRAWDYERGPLVRSRLLALGDDRQALVLTVASPCADAVSLATLAKEIAAHYDSRPTVDDPLQYADFAEWQNHLVTTDDEAASAARQYWNDARAGTTTLLPFARTVPPAATEVIDVPLNASSLAALESAADRYGVSPTAMVQAAWHALVGKLSGEDEVTIASISGRRAHAELETAVGAFARPVPLRAHLAGDLTVAELSVALQRAEELAERWQDFAPLDAASTGVGFVAIEPFEPIGAGEMTVSVRRLTPPPLFPLALEWDGSGCRLRFEPAALDSLSAARTARYVGRVLASIGASPEKGIGEIELLGDEDVRRLTVEVNCTAADVPESSIVDLVAAAAALSPTRLAVVAESGAVSYAELEERSTQLAHRLQRSGVGAGSVVGLCTDRSAEMVVGLLGILKAGAAYLPLNFEHPPARLAHQLLETNAPVIVAQEGLLDNLPTFDGEIVCLDRDRQSLDAESTTALNTSTSGDDLVYVIYTSGSTGMPKGVSVTNANLVNYVHAIGRSFGANEEPLAFGMVTAISTDLGNTAVFPALCHGGTLVLVSPAAAADAAAAAAFLRANPIDVLKITPSHLNALLVGQDAAGVLPKRWLVVGGEALSWDLVERVRDLGDCSILNHYGPTETTVGSCTFLVEDEALELSSATVPIGKPIANTSCYVLDGSRRCVPEGVAGELYIGGAGVARGYAGRSDLTAQRFVVDPFHGVGNSRMYATGDLVRRLPDGTLEFLGRSDDQLKIRGFRVEPAEIEMALRAYEPVQEAAILAPEDERGNRKLVAYVVTSRAVTTDQLRTHLAERIPDFMIPTAFVVLDSLPRTSSGKVDRLALPAPESGRDAFSAVYVPPRTPVEEAVAAIWRDVLGLEQVGVDDDFFALGGHSLLATQIVAQVRSDFSINLPLHALFTSPTVAMLSQQIVELMGQTPDTETEKLLSELEGLSDEEVALLLDEDRAPESSPQ